MNRYFVDLMLEQVHGGNKSDHIFNEQAWAHMVKLFNDKFGLTCDKYSLEKQYVSLMKDCNEISSLLSHRGFAWDGTQQMVTADDATWEDHVKVHSWFYQCHFSIFSKTAKLRSSLYPQCETVALASSYALFMEERAPAIVQWALVACMSAFYF
jgi:hypothetical protein